MKRQEPWNHTVKLYHYIEFMDTIDHIIESTSMNERTTNRERYLKRETPKNVFYGRETETDCLQVKEKDVYKEKQRKI